MADLWHLRLEHINNNKLTNIQTLAKKVDSFNEGHYILYTLHQKKTT